MLVILDGWGLSAETEGNAILEAKTPNMDKLMEIYPHVSLHASGEEVGLMWGENGNSEVGHINLGTGRVAMQDLLRISQSIDEGTFYSNIALLETFAYAKKNQKPVHLLGLCSNGGVHSHIDHLLALLEMAQRNNVENVYLHLISDGRDTAARVIEKDVKKVKEKMAELGVGQIATIAGRYWAMDRNKNWERTDLAYNALVKAAPEAKTIEEAIQTAYQSNQSDEFIKPTIISGTPRIKNDDAVICFNFRPDRIKQLSERILEKSKVLFTGFTNYGYEPSSRVKICFFSPSLKNQLAQVLSDNNLKQLHIAETEKYAHVTYFFNGGLEKEFSGEERILIPSPKVATFDLAPEMSAQAIAMEFIKFFNEKKPDFTVLNFANADMVGHTGKFTQTKKAIEVVDKSLGMVAATLIKADGDLIITADHGNAEQMIDFRTKEEDKEHTTNPVPAIFVFPEKKHEQEVVSLESKIAFAAQPPTGVLSDITTTILERLNLKVPDEMTGQNLGKIFL